LKLRDARSAVQLDDSADEKLQDGDILAPVGQRSHDEDVRMVSEVAADSEYDRPGSKTYDHEVASGSIVYADHLRTPSTRRGSMLS
jgi:hypothetical protein